MGGLGTIISLVLLVTAIGILVFIARELDSTKKRKLSGIILVLLSLLFLLAQVSFLMYPNERYKNWCGLFGHYSSYALFWLMGLYIFIIPALFGYAGYVLISDDKKKIGSRLLFFIPIGFIACALLAMFLVIDVNGMRSGGVLGFLISNFLADYFGQVGTYIILGFSIVVVVLMLVKEKVFPKIKVVKPADEAIKPPKKKKKKEQEPKPQQPPAAKAGTKPARQIDFKEEFLNIMQVPTQKYGVDTAHLQKESEILKKRLAEFDVTGEVVAVESGPVISRFEFQPDPGIKVNRIANLDNDLALALKATRIRVVAPIPGKSAVGIEVPNKERSLVYLKNGLVIDEFENHPSPLAIVLGEDITGQPVCEDIAVMPHMLIAGTTGSGKSVCINTLIASILYHSKPEDVRFLMIDPKRLELPMYNAIPHLLRRAITEPKAAVGELEKLVAVMEMRYRHFAREGVRDIDGYNEKMRKKGGKNKPYIVVVVDELADLMLTAPSEIEENITRLAQMSRAVGIHLVLATQRPSVDVITGLIKANFPCRIAFQVASKTDSRTILDMNGAESLLGRGDMLFLPPGKGTPVRLHGAYIAADEVSGIGRLIARMYLRELLQDVDCDLEETVDTIVDEELWTIFTDTNDVAFDEKRRALSNILAVEKIDEIIDAGYYPKLPETEVEEVVEEIETDITVDTLFEEAARLVFRHQVASVSLLQRRLNLGYARAGRIVDQLEAAGIVEPFQGSKSRKVLVEREDELNEIIKKYTTN
ncbi:MAG: DNA translocase FtsK 4TM domain-containing protein [candidate division WOR-3 bacterium]|nr:MAG: DNA translocase FtsK 4TM domain-containing protein [candidate division WOR-3 bacterium]